MCSTGKLLLAGTNLMTQQIHSITSENKTTSQNTPRLHKYTEKSFERQTSGETFILFYNLRRNCGRVKQTRHGRGDAQFISRGC